MATIVTTRNGIQYATIPGWPGYFVGDDGSVWSQWLPRRRQLGDVWRRLKPGVNSGGYLQVALYGQGKRFYVHVAALVLLAFVGPAPPGHEVCHKDGPRTDNRLTNIYWGTKSQNAFDRERLRAERCNGRRW